MAEVIIKNTQTIQPAEPTFSGHITLTELDMLGASFPYIPVIYIYKPTIDETETSKCSTTLIHRIRDSLSRTLVHFYPFAGRLTRDHNPLDQGGSVVVLQCGGGDGGAVLIEAESCNELAVYGDFSDHNLFHNLFPSVEQYDRKQMHEIPLLLVQLTRFSCGGFVLGITTSHVVDGRSTGHFIKEWARICRGESLAKPPFMDRTVLLKGGDELPFAGLSSADNEDEIDSLPEKLGSTHEEEKKQESETTTMVILTLTKTQVEKLKNIADAVTGDNTAKDDTNIFQYTRYEVITAHIWRCLCKAKGYDEKSDVLTKTVTVADVRGRVHPPLPSEYFGNGITRMVTICSAGQIVSNNLGFTCQKLRHSINRISNESITAEIQRLKRQRLNAGQVIQRKGDGSMLKIDLLVTNWLQLPLYGLDFGWGNEICMRRGLSTLNGAVNYMRGQDNEEEGLINVVICLRKSQVENFKNFFYQDL